jgi:hypothetical protein
MSNHIFKGLLMLLVCVALMSLPVSVLGDKPTPPPPPPPPPSSCTVVSYVMLSTYTASPGLNVGVFGRVTNCASGRKRLSVVMSSTSACGVETIISSNRIAFSGSQTLLVSSSYAIAPDTCLGAMEVNINVYDGSTLLGGGSTTLMIQ